MEFSSSSLHIRCRSSKSRILSTLILIFIFCLSEQKSLFCIFCVSFDWIPVTSRQKQANWELIICALIHLVTIPTIQFIGISTVRACIVKISSRKWRAQHHSKIECGKWFVSQNRIGLNWRPNSKIQSHAKKVPYTKPSTKTFYLRFHFCSKRRRQSTDGGEFDAKCRLIQSTDPLSPTLQCIDCFKRDHRLE